MTKQKSLPSNTTLPMKQALETRPYDGGFILDVDHAVNMIRHQYEGVERNVVVVIRQSCPAILDD